jgi:hypothetical protein
MLFLQYAIAAKRGVMSMYTLDCSSGRLPGWAHGVGTLSHEQIRKFGDQIQRSSRSNRTPSRSSAIPRPIAGKTLAAVKRPSRSVAPVSRRTDEREGEGLRSHRPRGLGSPWTQSGAVFYVVLGCAFWRHPLDAKSVNDNVAQNIRRYTMVVGMIAFFQSF